MQDQEARATAVAGAPARRDDADPQDVAGLYVRHRSTFTAQARRALRDQRDVDEVVQEAFLRMFLALPELETESQAVAYGRRTITNLCIDRYRAQARRPALVGLDSIAPEDAVEDDPGDPVVRAEEAAVVRQALAMLSPLHRKALVKREIEEKPLPVIADELGIPEDSVKHVLYRSRRALRRLLVGTSVAPGADGAEERRAAPRLGSRGVATLLALLLLGLGSGPDLEAVPVVGVDLPDLIGVTEAARTVGDVVTDVVDAVTPGGTTGATGAGRSSEVPVDRSGAAGSRPGAGLEPSAGRVLDGAAGPGGRSGTSADGDGAGPAAADGAAPVGGADGLAAGGAAARPAAGRAPGSPRAVDAVGAVDVPGTAARPQPASAAGQRGGRPQDAGRPAAAPAGSAAAPAGSAPGSAAAQRGAGRGPAEAVGRPAPAVGPAAPPAPPAPAGAHGRERAAAVSGGAAAAGGRAASHGRADRPVPASATAPDRGQGRHGERGPRAGAPAPAGSAATAPALAPADPVAAPVALEPASAPLGPDAGESGTSEVTAP